MWRRLSIRWQLIALLAFVLTFITAGSLALTYWFDVKERKALALEQVATLGRALEHDLLRALVNPQADVYSDISFRLSGFESLAALAVLDAKGVEVYRHVRPDIAPPHDWVARSTTEPMFTDRFLYLRQPITVDGYQYGEVVHYVDLASYRTGLREQLFSLLTIFPFELLVSLGLAFWVGRTYTQPFTELAQAMQDADVRNNRFPGVMTRSENEIGVLYRGYNDMIAQISRTTADLKHLSEHDSLTGLFNRYAMERAIAASLQDAQQQQHVLLALDLNQFKLVNDAAGHVAGDELLKRIGLICQSSLSEAALIARVGGDDFFILFNGIDEAGGVAQARRVLDAVRDYRFSWDGEVFAISACAGLVAFRPFEYTIEALLTAVDTAFYAAKANGHHQLHVYRPDDAKVQQYSADIQASAVIREALDGGPAQFELYAQAIVPLQHASERISYEVLLRLKTGDGELLTPNLFLPTAERYQLMTDIDCHVLWQYLQSVSARADHLERLDFVNINLAGATLSSSQFHERLQAAVERFAFPWHKLVLEVTETSAVGNLAKAADFIAWCRKLGMRVALDDFGTGMASFEYLKFLPLDIVKIDGAFIRDMLSDPIDHAMVSYAHHISKLRGQQTIAEFIERPEHLAALQAIGIDYGQGYHLGRPQPLAHWLERNSQIEQGGTRWRASA